MARSPRRAEPPLLWTFPTISEGFSRGFPPHPESRTIPSSRNAPRFRNRAESGQRDRDLRPGGNTATETTPLSGYGVDTLRRADNSSRHRELVLPR